MNSESDIYVASNTSHGTMKNKSIQNTDKFTW